MQKLKKIKQSKLVTEEYVDGKLDALMKYVDFKIKPLENLHEEFVQLKSDMFDRLDWIIGTLKRMEEEMIIMNQHIKELTQRVDNHETRLQKIELSEA